MVKFNPKIANKFANRAARRAKESKHVTPDYIRQEVKRSAEQNQDENLRVWAQREVNKRLFGITAAINEGKDSPFFFVSMDTIFESKDWNEATYETIADWVTSKIVKEGYVLYLDDERCPDAGETQGIGNCVVVRNCSDAQRIVEQLGCPRFMHLDWYLGSGLNSSDHFVKWFVEKFTPLDSVVWEDFSWQCHSSASEGRRTVNKLMADFDNEVFTTRENRKLRVEQKDPVAPEDEVIEVVEAAPVLQSSAPAILDAVKPPDLGAY